MSLRSLILLNSLKFYNSNLIRNVSTSLPRVQQRQIQFSFENERKEFDRTFPEVVETLLRNEQFGHLNEITKRLSDSLFYNVPKGKRNRGLAVVTSYKILEKTQNLSEENVKLANILGWTVEMLQAFFLVMDDITDGSEQRRGQPCWYKRKEIGLTAINDGLILERSIYLILKEYFKQHPCYLNFVELFHNVTLLTCVGQVLDNNTLNVSDLNLKRVELIAVNKTAYYSFYLPIALALYLSNVVNKDTHKVVEEISLEIGKFFQIQDDYLDCFGDPKVTGKIGTDIETAKCTWLAALAIEISTESQKEIMIENYGKPDENCVKNVKDLYLQLGLPKLYEEYEEKSYEEIRRMLLKLPGDVPKELFDQIISKIYKRIS